VRLLLDKGLRVDTWKLDANTLASIDSKVEILLNLVDIHVFLGIQSSEINSVLDRDVNELGKDNTALHGVE
jgi:hypothetical protein